METSKGGTKVGRMKDPLYKDSYLGITPPTFILPFEAPESSMKGWSSSGLRSLGLRGPGGVMLVQRLAAKAAKCAPWASCTTPLAPNASYITSRQTPTNNYHKPYTRPYSILYSLKETLTTPELQRHLWVSTRSKTSRRPEKAGMG